MVPAISGGLARALAVVCVEPLEFLKTQAQAREAFARLFIAACPAV